MYANFDKTNVLDNSVDFGLSTFCRIAAVNTLCFLAVNAWNAAQKAQNTESTLFDDSVFTPVAPVGTEDNSKATLDLDTMLEGYAAARILAAWQATRPDPEDGRRPIKMVQDRIRHPEYFIGRNLDYGVPFVVARAEVEARKFTMGKSDAEVEALVKTVKEARLKQLAEARPQAIKDIATPMSICVKDFAVKLRDADEESLVKLVNDAIEDAGRTPLREYWGACHAYYNAMRSRMLRGEFVKSNTAILAFVDAHPEWLPKGVPTTTVTPPTEEAAPATA